MLTLYIDEPQHAGYLTLRSAGIGDTAPVRNYGAG
jgi:hypothetical protein